MAKYIVQMRRGTSAQWADTDIIPLEGELVVEIDDVNNLHKLKIGDGIHTYAELAYLMAGDEIVTQVLAQALPRVITVTLDAEKWTEITCETDPNLGYYGQAITIDNITEYSRLDLQPSADMLAEFQSLNVAFVTENKGGAITVYSVGDKPLKSYTMQATIVETDITVDGEKVIGTPVGTSAPAIGKRFGPTEMGNEIFNDYENNYAGTKAFNIIAYEGTHGQPGTYTLDSVEGLEVGDIYSVHVFNTDQSDPAKSSLRLDNGGEITAIDGNVVSVSYLYLAYGTVETDITKEGHSYFRVAEKPDVGTRYVEGMAHVEGKMNKALGYGSHAEGYDNISNGAWSHVEGRSNYANYNSHAEGRNTQSLGETTHSEGGDTVARKSYSHAEGFKSQTDAIAAHAEGEESTATGRAAHAEGFKTQSSGAHAHTEGELTQATSNNAHAEGYNSKATASGAHAEGANTQAKAAYSHAEGRNTVVEGDYAHAEGDSTEATKLGAHAEGQNTHATGERSHAEGTGSTASGGSAHAEGDKTIASVWGGHAEGIQSKAHTGAGAHAEGYLTEAGAQGSHAEGVSTKATADRSHAEGYKTTASGAASHAEGDTTEATVWGAHAEGTSTHATGGSAHAEGSGTTASGARSHAEGQNTIASGSESHTEGTGTSAKGWASHAEGRGTIAAGNFQHVEGEYNIEDTENKYIHIAGNGTSNVRSNAYTLDKDGNAVFAGDVKVANGSIELREGQYEAGGAMGTLYTAQLVHDGNIALECDGYLHDVTINGNLKVHKNGGATLGDKGIATEDYVDNKFKKGEFEESISLPALKIVQNSSEEVAFESEMMPQLTFTQMNGEPRAVFAKDIEAGDTVYGTFGNFSYGLNVGEQPVVVKSDLEEYIKDSDLSHYLKNSDTTGLAILSGKTQSSTNLSGTKSTVIGLTDDYGVVAKGKENIVIGNAAGATADYAMQFGHAWNGEANTVQFGGDAHIINKLDIYQDAAHAADGIKGRHALATEAYVDQRASKRYSLGVTDIHAFKASLSNVRGDVTSHNYMDSISLDQEKVRTALLAWEADHTIEIYYDDAYMARVDEIKDGTIIYGAYWSYHLKSTEFNIMTLITGVEYDENGYPVSNTLATSSSIATTSAIFVKSNIKISATANQDSTGTMPESITVSCAEELNALLDKGGNKVLGFIAYFNVIGSISTPEFFPWIDELSHSGGASYVTKTIGQYTFSYDGKLVLANPSGPECILTLEIVLA